MPNVSKNYTCIMNDTINIEAALRKFNVSTSDEGKTLVYGFRYIKPTGEMGEKICFKKHSNKMRGTKKAQSEEDRKGGYNLKRNGAMLVHDVETDSPKRLTVAHLIEFKDNNSSKWKKIIH